MFAGCVTVGNHNTVNAAPSSSHTTNRQTDHPTDQQSDHQTTEEDESILTEVHVDTGVGVAYFKKGKSYHIKIKKLKILILF